MGANANEDYEEIQTIARASSFATSASQERANVRGVKEKRNRVAKQRLVAFSADDDWQSEFAFDPFFHHEPSSQRLKDVSGTTKQSLFATTVSQCQVFLFFFSLNKSTTSFHLDRHSHQTTNSTQVCDHGGGVGAQIRFGAPAVSIAKGTRVQWQREKVQGRRIDHAATRRQTRRCRTTLARLQHSGR